MKKNFFKKLSFVLALAMIVSVLAPAAGAFAAKAPKLNASSKTLYLGVDGKDEFDFNISNKVKGWKYKWSSANANVASVNKKNGVTTATGAGTTKISVVIADKNGEEVDELTATVLVRDNIKELTITNLPADGKVAVGVAHDFNRSYVTVANKTKGSQAITRWSVSPSEDATITDSGVFTANKAGEYTITARAFQSKAKYTSWLSDATKYASYVTAEATYKVSVAASMVKAEQVDVDTFKVTFDSPVTDVATKLAVYYMAGNTKVKNLVKKVTMDADNKVATVDMYVEFTKGSGVVVDYPGMKSVEFIAATTNVADVVSIAITSTTAELATVKELEVSFLNKDGVNIATTDLYNRLTWASSSNATSLSGRNLMMYRIGDTTTITATFHTYNYEGGKEVGTLSASQVVTCVDKTNATTGLLNAYTVVASGVSAAPNWKDVKHTIAAGDGAKQFFAQLKGKKADGSDNLTVNPNNASSLFTFKSSDTSIIVINETTGVLYGAKEGSAEIVVSYDKVVVGAATITVTGPKRVAEATLSSNGFNLSNDLDVDDTKTVDLTVKDQLGNTYNNYDVKIEINGRTTDNGLLKTSTTAAPFRFQADGVTEGTYSYTVTVTDKADSNVKYVQYINVNVQKPSSDTEVYYTAVEPSSNNYDMKIKSTDANYKETVTLSLFTYASNNVRNNRIDITLGGITVKVTDPNGKDYTILNGGLTTSGSDATLELVTTTGSSIISKLPKGTYKLSATNASGDPINANYFVVDDTQPVPTVAVDKLVSEKTNLLDAINDCLAITLNGDEYTLLAGDYVDAYDVATNGGKTAYITKVYVLETVPGSATIRHEVAVNAPITFK